MSKRGVDKRMNKYKFAALCASVAFMFSSSTVLGAFPNIQYAESESVKVYWNGMSAINTLSPGAEIQTIP